ncbi:MAG: DUF4203 domain-containing protein [Eubacterium sp.]|nr:DUF4203 domain-containing protein [Eubacterium sp.]
MENIDKIREVISYLSKARKLTDLLNPEGLPGGAEMAKIASQIVAVAAVIALILSLLQCFFGYKMLRFWVALIGFVIGFTAGSGILANIMEEPSRVLIVLVGITAGAMLGILAFKLYVVGVFIYCGLMGVAVVALLPFRENDTMQTAMVVLAVIVFIAAGVLAVIFQRYVIVIVSAVAGGIHAAGALSLLVPELSSSRMTAAAAVVLMILGAAVQLLTTRDRKKKARRKE